MLEVHALIFRSNQELPANHRAPMRASGFLILPKIRSPGDVDFVNPVSQFSAVPKIPWGTCFSAAVNPKQVRMFSGSFHRGWKGQESVWLTRQPQTGEVIFSVISSDFVVFLMPKQKPRKAHCKNIQLPHYNQCSHWTIWDHLTQLPSSWCVCLTEGSSQITHLSVRASFASTNS